MRPVVVALAGMLAALPPLPAQVPRLSSDTGSAPTVFGPGVLSVGEVYRGAFGADGQSFLFFRKVGKGEEYRIFISEFGAGTWSEPRRLDLGGDFSDLYPSLSRDGRRLAFTSYRPFPGDTAHTAHVWYADRVGSGWGSPVPLPGNLPGYYHAWVEIGRDGSIYFRQTTPDFRSTQTLVAHPLGDGYSLPVPYSPAVEARRRRPDLQIAGVSPGPNDTTVFLDVATRDEETKRRGSDIWVMTQAGATWSDPRRLDDSINGPGFDVFPFFSPDGTEMFFVRDFRLFYRIAVGKALHLAN